MPSVLQANAILIESARRIHILVPGTYIVGRSRRADIHLLDARASRQHLQLELTDDGMKATDLDSKNGTLLNGKPLTSSQRLRPGDQLRVGAHVLEAIQHGESMYAPGHSLFLVGQEAHNASGTTEVTARVLDLLDVLTDDVAPGRHVPETLDTIVAVVDDLLDRAGMTQPYLTEAEAARLSHVVDVVTRQSQSTAMLRWRSGVASRIAPLVDRRRPTEDQRM